MDINRLRQLAGTPVTENEQVKVTVPVELDLTELISYWDSEGIDTDIVKKIVNSEEFVAYLKEILEDGDTVGGYIDEYIESKLDDMG